MISSTLNALADSDSRCIFPVGLLSPALLAFAIDDIIAIDALNSSPDSVPALLQSLLSCFVLGAYYSPVLLSDRCFRSNPVQQFTCFGLSGCVVLDAIVLCIRSMPFNASDAFRDSHLILNLFGVLRFC
jgi:hypothetical protein